MQRLRPKALPAWPDPTSSMGQKINTRTRRIGRSLVWFPRGPALERYNEVIRPEVEGILNNIELPEGEKLIVKLYMIGRSEQKANPIVMICCPDKATRKEAEALIRESELLERDDNCGFGLGSTGFPLETSFLPRPLGKAIYLGINPPTQGAWQVDVYGLTEPGIGRKLVFVTYSQSGDSAIQYATGGPIVHLGGHIYQLTVAHAARPYSDSKDPQEQGSDADECDFDGQSDEDDDEHIILSRGSVSPGLPMRDYSDLDSDRQQSQVSSAYSDSYPMTPDTRYSQSQKMAAPLSSPTAAELAGKHDQWKSSTPLGSFPMPDGYGGELDYLLIKLPDENSGLVKGLNEVTFEEPFRSHRLHVNDIASTNNADVSIVAVTSRGLIPGNILADAVSFKTRRSCSFQQLLTVLLSKGLREGDSGSALVDAQTGHFYGYVILGVDGDCVAYALPSPMIMAKITTQFRHLPAFHRASEQTPSSSSFVAQSHPVDNLTTHMQGWPSSSSIPVPPIPGASDQSGNYMVPLGDHINLQGDLLEARREVQRLNTELRNRRPELEGSRGELLDPALVRDMQTAISDPRFQDELNSLERWFYVVSAGQQSVALHTLLQNANPAHVDYIRHVLRRRGSITPLSELIGTNTAGSNIGSSVAGSSRQYKEESSSMDPSNERYGE